MADCYNDAEENWDDYGMEGERSEMRSAAPRRGKRPRSILSLLILAVLLIVFVFSGYNFLKEFLTYKEAGDEYRKLDTYIEEEQARQPEEAATAETQENPIDDPEYYPALNIDFEKLQEINQDFLGVLYIPALDLKYPVAHSKDNAEYLHRTFEGTSNPSGCIFMDKDNSADFSDNNTLIYGHNMKNETMFGSLKRFSKDSALAKDDPYFYIYTKDRVYKYNIFSYRTVSTSDSLYNPFSGDDAYDRYVQKALTGNQGDFPQKTDFSLRPNLMTLSTCWGTGHVYNFVVQGALTHIVMTDGTASAEEAD